MSAVARELLFGGGMDNNFSTDTITLCENTPLLRYWAAQQNSSSDNFLGGKQE